MIAALGNISWLISIALATVLYGLLRFGFKVAIQKRENIIERERESFLLKQSRESLLALRFEEALQPSVFLAHLKTSAENQTKRQFASVANDAFKSALAGAKFLYDQNGLKVVFKGGIPKGAKLMADSAGKLIPILLDDRGKTLKIARGVSSAGKAASTAAAAALVVVEAAHMISNQDNAQRLKKLERSADALLHAHELELKSRLQAIYRHSKEIMGGDLDQLSDYDRHSLHSQCRDLMELRAHWQGFFQQRLGQIEKAEPGWINKVLWWRKEEGIQKDREGKAAEAVDVLEFVQLMHFSLMLQMCLAGASGHMESFRRHTLPDDCQSWIALKEFTNKRVKEICGDIEVPEFRAFTEAISDLVEFWSVGRWDEAQNRFIDGKSKEITRSAGENEGKSLD